MNPWQWPMRGLGRAVRWLSASRVHHRTTDGIELARAGGFVRAFLMRGRFSAITIGETVLFLGSVPEEGLPLVRHELVHVAQARRWGPLFPLAYALGWLLGLHRAVVLGATTWHGIYQLNPFEVEARKVERLTGSR